MTNFLSRLILLRRLLGSFCSIDRLEELFTDGIIAEKRHMFLEVLAELSRYNPAWSFSQCGAISSRGLSISVAARPSPSQGTASYHLAPPAPAELGQIILRSAQVARLKFDIHLETGHQGAARGIDPSPQRSARRNVLGEFSRASSLMSSSRSSPDQPKYRSRQTARDNLPVGVMNLAWITALNVFVLLEKIIPWRFWAAKIIGRPVDQSFHAAPESIHFPYYERIGLAQLGQSLIHSTFAISQVVRLQRL